jgi:hypothetical protein
MNPGDVINYLGQEWQVLAIDTRQVQLIENEEKPIRDVITVSIARLEGSYITDLLQKRKNNK